MTSYLVPGRQLMLARYKIYRGKRPSGDPLPDGVRQDTRKHTHHCLRPSAKIVTAYLAGPTPQAWKRFAAEYEEILKERFARDRTPFDKLAEQATQDDVYLGCSCPTEKNPDVNHCHTVLALRFLQQHYPRLKVVFP
jgi:hypothetical protein